MTSPATLRRLFIALAVVAVVLGGTLLINRLKAHPTGGDPANDIPALKAVQTFSYVGAQHTTDPVTYSQTPPAGGPHDPTWNDCGIYTQPVRNENTVHDLEHGTVWITYRPGESAAGIQKLEEALATVKSKKTILSPYPGLPAPVVVTVWNAQLDLKGADDPRLPAFIKFYGDGHTAPEASVASCAGGSHIMASPDNP